MEAAIDHSFHLNQCTPYGQLMTTETHLNGIINWSYWLCTLVQVKAVVNVSLHASTVVLKTSEVTSFGENVLLISAQIVL